MPQEDRLMVSDSPFIDIPDELILLIADHLPLESLLRLRTTNKQLWTLLTPKINECVKKCLPQQIVAGGCHTLALTEAGALYAWGYNDYGQLGIGNTVDQNAPVKIEGFDGDAIKQIVTGAHHTLALTEAGALYAWGDNQYGQLGIGSREHQLNAPVIIPKFRELLKISSDGITNAYRFFNPKADSPAHPTEGGAALPLPKRAMECTVL